MVASDYPSVRRLWERSPGVGLNQSDSRTSTTRFLRRNPGLSFVATDSTRIVGAVICGTEGRRGHLGHLAVDPARQRSGVGTALVNACLAALRSRNVLKCNILLFKSNAKGKKFWQARGWVERKDLVIMQIATSR
jgi:ribosomal protein S18 acetylase RimI-like enzyme